VASFLWGQRKKQGVLPKFGLVETASTPQLPANPGCQIIAALGLGNDAQTIAARGASDKAWQGGPSGYCQGTLWRVAEQGRNLGGHVVHHFRGRSANKSRPARPPIQGPEVV